MAALKFLKLKFLFHHRLQISFSLDNKCSSFYLEFIPYIIALFFFFFNLYQNLLLNPIILFWPWRTNGTKNCTSVCCYFICGLTSNPVWTAFYTHSVNLIIFVQMHVAIASIDVTRVYILLPRRGFHWKVSLKSSIIFTSFLDCVNNRLRIRLSTTSCVYQLPQA